MESFSTESDGLLGARAVLSVLVFATVTGILMSLFLNNAGGAWDNGKLQTAHIVVGWFVCEVVCGRAETRVYMCEYVSCVRACMHVRVARSFFSSVKNSITCT